MSSSRPRSSSLPDRNTAFRITLYGFIVLFLGNLGAMIDLAFHPEIPYFDEEHLIVGGVTAVTAVLLLGALESYLARRKQMEAKLIEGNERLRSAEAKRSMTLRMLESIVSSNPDVIFSVDLNLNLTMWNRALEVVTGLAPEALKSKSALELFVEEDRPSLLRSVQKCLEEGEGEAEVRLFNAQGGFTLLHIKGVLLKGEDGSVVGITGSGRDITARKQAEVEKRSLERQVRQAQKMESLGVLAGGIAHDFNNLLMVVLGYAELALKEISPISPARRSLEEITIATQRAADLSLQMLTYSGKAVFTVERVDLRDLVEEMADLLKTTISKKAILTLNLEKGLPAIQADPDRIRQIVMNLIINASEAIGDRGGAITVSVGTTRCDEEHLRKTELHDDLPPGMYVHLEVTDTGGGMDAETRSRIFEPFFTTKFTGRGLGLAAVLGIVRSHKGALKVYSEPGKGTTFKILFPALTDGKG